MCTFVQSDLDNATYNAHDLLGLSEMLIQLRGQVYKTSTLQHFEQKLPAQYRFLKNLIGSGMRTIVVATVPQNSGS